MVRRCDFAVVGIAEGTFDQHGAPAETRASVQSRRRGRAMPIPRIAPPPRAPPPPQQQPLFSPVRALALILPLLLLLVVTRPDAIDWPDAVGRMRIKEKNAAGSLSLTMKKLPRNIPAIISLAFERATVGTHISEDDPRIWATQYIFFSVGCTHKKCFAGVLGAWRPMPDREFDLYALLACHGAACLLAHTYGMLFFFQTFSPSLSKPHTLLTAIFATSSPFEMLWLCGCILGVGSDLQRAIGRIGFLILYIAGGVSSVLLAAYNRHSANGAGGALASMAYHALAAPRARHNILGFDMGAKMALAVQAGLASWPAFNGAPQPLLILALNGLPMLVGAGAYQMRGVLR